MPVLWFHLYKVPDSSVGKEFACNAGDPGSILGSGRSTGEGIGYPLQYSWASLVAKLVKNLPVMWESWVRSLAWEDALEKGKATHSSIMAWRIPWTTQSRGRREWDTTERLSLSLQRATSNKPTTLPKGASLVAQLVKNLPAMQETQVPFLGGEDPLHKG